MSSSSDSEEDKWIPPYVFSEQAPCGNTIIPNDLKINGDKSIQRSFTCSSEVPQTFLFDDDIERIAVKKKTDLRTIPNVKGEQSYVNLFFDDKYSVKHKEDNISNQIKNVAKIDIQVDNFQTKEEVAYKTREAQAAVGPSHISQTYALKSEPCIGRVSSGLSKTCSPFDQSFQTESSVNQPSSLSKLMNNRNDKKDSFFLNIQSSDSAKTEYTAKEIADYCVNDLQILQTTTFEATNKEPTVNESPFRFTAGSESGYKRDSRPLSMSTSKMLKKQESTYFEHVKQDVLYKERYQKKNHAIYLTQADITTLPVDVIIVSAYFNGGRQCTKKGLAKSVDDAALRSGTENLNLEVNTHGKFPVIIATTVDQLPCKMVIHAIVEMSDNRFKQSSFVDDRIIESLKKANLHSYRSVAIPGLFSAIEMNLAESSEFLIVDAVRKYFENSVNSSVEDIYFCDMNEKKLDKFQTIISKVYSPKRTCQPVDADILVLQYDKAGKREDIQFCIGDITNRKVDIIVNVLGNEMNLKDGTLSKSIVDKAGQEVLTELRKQISVDKNKFIVTGGGRLFCKKIIHGVLRHWSKTTESKETLQYFMQHCLLLAESMNMRSIAFPAVGTGFHKYPPDIVAREMISLTMAFCTSYLTKIEFVVFHDNTDVIKSFEAEMKKYIKDQTYRNKPTIHSSKITPSLLREFQSHTEFRAEQDELFENSVKHHRANWVDSSQPQLKYEASSQLNYPGKSLSAAVCRNRKDCGYSNDGGHPPEISQREPSDIQCGEHVEMESVKYGERVRQVQNRQPFGSEMKKYVKDQTIRTKPSTYSSKIDNSSKNTSWFELRESQSHAKSTDEQNELLENFLQHHSANRPESSQPQLTYKNVLQHCNPYRRPNSALPQSRYEAISPHLYYDDAYPGKSPSAVGSYKKECVYSDDGSYSPVLTPKEPTDIECEEHVEIEILKYGDIVRQLKYSQNLVHCKADRSVEIEIKMNGKIVVSGPTSCVSKTKRSIKSYLKRLEKAEEVSQYVEWGYLNHNGQNEIFEKLLSYDLESKYKENIKSTKFDHDGALLVVSYKSMLMWYEGANETKYKISRYPKDSVSSNVCLPSTWTNMKPGVLCFEQEVDSGDEICNFLREQFQQARRNIKILKILRVQNQHLYSQYKSRQGALHEKNGRGSEQLLWHGTSEDCVDKIINNGFNRSYCGRNGTAYGKGVYFAVKVDLSLKYAPTPSGIGHMFLASVAVGDTCKGYRDMQALPSPPGRPKHITYDSACDNPFNPTMYVIFHDTQAYPSYHITFENRHIC